MNYFGHALVASWRGAAPATTLGAMLPDFATMCGGKLAAAQAPLVDEGLALHHATDAAFHDLPAVVGLMRELDHRLDELGCARGPRRATAHVGVELLLDGVLIDDEVARAAYDAAIAADIAVAWDTGDERYAMLLARLRSYGAPIDLKDPVSITQRLQRILMHRPLLKPNDADLRAILVALTDVQPRVRVAAETVLRGVRARLT